MAYCVYKSVKYDVTPENILRVFTDDKLVGSKQRTTIKSRLGQPHDMNKSAPSRQTEVKTSVKQRLGFSKKLVNGS